MEETKLTKREIRREEKKKEKELREKRKKEDKAMKAKLKAMTPKKSHWGLMRAELYASHIVNMMDITFDTIDESWPGLGGFLENVGAAIIKYTDYGIDVLCWAVTKWFVLLLRKIHSFREFLGRVKSSIIKMAIGAGAVALLLTLTYGSVMGFEYSYNGKALGIVKEQNEVVDILELVSDELSISYNAVIKIDPDRDITFKPTITINKDIDTADGVLKKFSCLGDVQLTAYGIYADDELVVILDTEAHANEVLDDLMEEAVSDEGTYEEAGFVQDVEVREVQTTLDKIANTESAKEIINTTDSHIGTYEIVLGDTISAVCERYGMTMAEFLELNPDYTEGDYIKIGQEFNIITTTSLITIETVRISTFAQAISYDTEYVDSPDYYMDTYITLNDGSEGRKSITAKIKERNGEEISREIINEEVLVEPVNRVVAHGTKPIPERTGTGTFIKPVTSYTGIGSRYGYRINPITGAWALHEGIDIQANYGTSIMASDGGTVTYSGWDSSYGYYIIIDHGGLFKTYYCHCSELLVATGEKVYQGQIIARVGSTGYSTGPHLDFRIMYDGQFIDPENYVSY